MKTDITPKQYNHYDALNEIQNIISSGPFNGIDINDRARISYFFVLIRKIIDCLISIEDRKKYGLLNFYCTWTLHVDMDRNHVCIIKLKEISLLFQNNIDNPNLREILSKELSLDEIPQQINELIIACGMTSKNVIDENIWKQIEPILLGLISTAPLKSKSNNEYLKEISVITQPAIIHGFIDRPNEHIFCFKLIAKDSERGTFISIPILNQ